MMAASAMLTWIPKRSLIQSTSLTSPNQGDAHLTTTFALPHGTRIPMDAEFLVAAPEGIELHFGKAMANGEEFCSGVPAANTLALRPLRAMDGPAEIEITAALSAAPTTTDGGPVLVWYVLNGDIALIASVPPPLRGGAAAATLTS